MKRVLTLAALAIAFVGCTQQQAQTQICQLAVKATYSAAQGVADALQCSHPEAIAAELIIPINKIGICATTQAAGSIANLVCPQVTTFVTGLGMSALPAAWGCAGGATVANAQAVMTAACEKYIKY